MTRIKKIKDWVVEKPLFEPLEFKNNKYPTKVLRLHDNEVFTKEDSVYYNGMLGNITVFCLDNIHVFAAMEWHDKEKRGVYKGKINQFIKHTYTKI